MSLWSRMANVFRGERVRREIDEELESHIEEAVESGRDPGEARRALGSALRHREESGDVRLVAWLDALRADVVFGWRQLAKSKVTSAAAVLSLGLAIGACTAAFRLIDALLLRPLPIAEPERLYAVSRQGFGPDGQLRIGDSCAYPMFRQMRTAVRGEAELLAVSFAERMDVTYGSDQEMEKAQWQYVSGWLFRSLGLQPALGRVLTEADDRTPGAHPYAVLSHDYWTRRFGQDARVIGRTFRRGNTLYEIVGVAEERFTGTEPGTVIDVFVPTMMQPAVTRPDSTWFRTLVWLSPGADVGPVRDKLHATARAFEEERAKRFTNTPRHFIAQLLNWTLVLEPAPSGMSNMQRDNRPSLTILGVLVALVLLIACANVANLMTARAAARAREMALRVSIGAGRWRLVQLVLVESAWVAFLATALGGVFAWWAAPFVVGLINPPDNPARLFLPADGRVIGFSLALAFGVTFLFGLAPALRASGVKPAGALKGGEDPHARRHLMHALIAVQVAFCFVVHFVGGLFVATYDRLAHQPTGFSAERLLTLDAATAQPQLPVYWEQVAAHLRTVPGVETVALADQPLLNGYSWNGFIWVNGALANGELAYFRSVSPGWTEAMRIAFVDGRDFRPTDTYPGAALVNETFAKQYFGGENPVGRFFERPTRDGRRIRTQVVGLVRDARYRSLREPMLPVAYFPFPVVDAKGALQPTSHGTFVVRTANPDPLTLASVLRREVPRARSEFRVSNVRTQQELVEMHTVRERLLAMLALFFAVVALVLAAVGLYGVLDYSVLQRRREIGIRMALGAPAGSVVRRVTGDAFSMVLMGAAAGLALGMASERYLEALLYQVKATDLAMLALPTATVLGAALVAALPPVIRAVRLDPVAMLRAD